MNEEELEEWAKEKAKLCIINLNKVIIKGRYLDFKGLCGLLTQAIKAGYNKALEDIDKKE